MFLVSRPPLCPHRGLAESMGHTTGLASSTLSPGCLKRQLVPRNETRNLSGSREPSQGILGKRNEKKTRKGKPEKESPKRKARKGQGIKKVRSLLFEFPFFIWISLKERQVWSVMRIQTHVNCRIAQLVTAVLFFCFVPRYTDLKLGLRVCL